MGGINLDFREQIKEMSEGGARGVTNHPWDGTRSLQETFACLLDLDALC